MAFLHSLKNAECLTSEKYDQAIFWLVAVSKESFSDWKVLTKALKVKFMSSSLVLTGLIPAKKLLLTRLQMLIIFIRKYSYSSSFFL